MPLTVYQIPFTFTLTGLRLIAASSPHEAADIASKDMQFEEANLYESDVFWDEGARLTDIQCVPSFDAATPFEGDPIEEGFEPEDLETEAEHDARLYREQGDDMAAQAEDTERK